MEKNQHLSAGCVVYANAKKKKKKKTKITICVCITSVNIYGFM